VAVERSHAETGFDNAAQFASRECPVMEFGVSSSFAVATHRDAPRPTSGATICRSAMLLETPNSITEHSLLVN